MLFADISNAVVSIGKVRTVQRFDIRRRRQDDELASVIDVPVELDRTDEEFEN
jgi:hypothetical protein